MISIDRSRVEAPQALITGGKQDLPRIRKLRRDGSLNSKSFNRRIYSSEAVRTALWVMQYHKCCFCERPYERKSSAVEHFRPKTKARRSARRRVWGYWWLAYDFRNLYFCCQNCNSPKSDWFPVRGRGLRAGQRPWTHKEDAILIDPGFENPEKHVTYVHDEADRLRITSLDERGEKMIEVAQLDRDDLNDFRDFHCEEFIQPVIDRYRKAEAEKNAAQKAVAEADAERLCHAKMPYALLARIAFRDAGIR